MKSTSSTKRSGFTLIELLTVIAIIGILAAVLFPGVQGVMKKAKQSTASTKVRNIAQAAITFHDGKKYIKSGSWTVTTNSSATSPADYAAVLSYNVGLNTAELWYVDADQLNQNATFPKYVLTGAAGSQTPDANFKAPGDGTGWHSWDAYVPTRKDCDPNIPLLWTRGLSTTGTWDKDKGVWASDGGHIAYGDAHVVWATSTTDDNGNGIFIDLSTSQTTTNWKNAVSKGTATLVSDKQ